MCDSLDTFVIDCGNNLGGIKRVAIKDQAEITSYAQSNGVITAITQTGGFIEIPLKRNNQNADSDDKVDLTKGSTYTENTLALSVQHRRAAVSEVLRLTKQGQRDLAIIYQDGNNRWWYLENMQYSGNKQTTGRVKADGSMYDVTFVGESEDIEYEVLSSIVGALIN